MDPIALRLGPRRLRYQDHRLETGLLCELFSETDSQVLLPPAIGAEGSKKGLA